MKIAIVVINWNGLELLKKYLKKIIDNSNMSTFYCTEEVSLAEKLLVTGLSDYERQMWNLVFDMLLFATGVLTTVKCSETENLRFP